MYTNLPMISAAGLFHSRDKFSDSHRYPENSVTKLRTAVDYELELFTLDGGISHLNGSSYPIKKGSLLIVEPGDKRQSTLHFSALFIHFGTSDKAVQDLIHSVRGFHPGMDYQKLSSDLSDICNIALSFEPDSDILAAARLISFLCSIKKICFMNLSSRTDSPGYSAVSKAIIFMKQNYREPLTIRQIADYCCLSTSYFHKLFVETSHTTPNNYLLKIRLAAAKSLLLSTTLPVSDVAEQCGFHSQAYFSDCFKRHFGVTAKEFRSSAF